MRSGTSRLSNGLHVIWVLKVPAAVESTFGNSWQ